MTLDGAIAWMNLNLLARSGSRGGPAVAVGMPVSRHPPHGPVLALLMHTVLTLDQGMFGVETLGRIRLQDLDWR